MIQENNQQFLGFRGFLGAGITSAEAKGYWTGSHPANVDLPADEIQWPPRPTGPRTHVREEVESPFLGCNEIRL